MKARIQCRGPRAGPPGAGVALVLALLIALAAGSIGAAIPPDALEEIRHLAILHNGRLKPFDSFARETLERLTGSPSLREEDPVQTVLSIALFPDHWQEIPLVSVPFIPLREKLGMDRRARRVSYNNLVETRALMRMLPSIVEKQQEGEKLSILENETMDVFDRFLLLSSLFKQEFHLVPPAENPSAPKAKSQLHAAWLPILQPEGYPEGRQTEIRNTWESLAASVRQNDPKVITTSTHALSTLLGGMNPQGYPASWRLRLEVFYNRSGIFRIARIFYGMAALFLLMGLLRGKGAVLSLGSATLFAGFLLHGAGILIRVILAGRPPVSNFYETMLWMPFVAVGLALFFERIYRAGAFGFSAAILAGLVLLLADHLPLDSSISPVVAVLRSNLWLTIHVLTMVGSYAPITLGLVLAHIYGVIYLTRGARDPSLEKLGIYLYRSIQVGVVLLAAGIMLGAVWANASWGRYWGWDPKETWALITLLWFLSVLHGRFAGWLKGVGVAVSTIAGFFLLLMTYYGVSFYLVGLHSYAGGHAKPIPPLLLGYVGLEIIFLFILSFVALLRKPVSDTRSTF